MSQEASPSVIHNTNIPTKNPKPKFPGKLLLIIVGIVVLITGASVFFVSTQPSRQPEHQATYFPPETYVPNQLVIKYKEGQISQQIDEFDKKIGVTSKERVFKDTNDPDLIRFYTLYLPQGSDVIAVENQYLQQDFIETSQPNFIMKVFVTAPNDSLYPQMWDLTKIQMPQAWDIQKGSASVTVGVVDSGIDLNHPDLPRNNISGYNFQNRSSNLFDDVNHGSHVSGTIGALTNNGTGVSGINWNIRIVMAKALGGPQGSGSLTDMADGLRYVADQGARVINLSLGGPMPCQFNPAFQSAVSYAMGKGALVVTAAGNDRTDSSNFSPASCNGVLNVGNSNAADQRYPTSNFGSKVHIAAPGASIWSAKSTTTTSIGPCQYGSDPNYIACSGTSMAAPHVVGVAALLFAQNPSWSADQVRNCLLSSADPITTDYPIGNKRLNAYRALTECGNNTTPTNPTNPNPPTNTQPCTITSAHWSPSGTVNDGRTVNLIVDSTGNCSGKQINVDVWRNVPLLQGGIDQPAVTKPASVFFSGNTATTTWGAKYECSGLSCTSNSVKYYFKVNIVGDSNVVRSSDPLLEVLIPGSPTVINNPPPPSGGLNQPPPPRGNNPPPPPTTGNNPPPPSQTGLNPPPRPLTPPPPAVVPPPDDAQPTEEPEILYTCDQVDNSGGNNLQLQIRRLICRLSSSGGPAAPPPTTVTPVPPTITPPVNPPTGITPPTITPPTTTSNRCPMDSGRFVTANCQCVHPDGVLGEKILCQNQQCQSVVGGASGLNCTIRSGGRIGSPSDPCSHYSGNGYLCLSKPVIYLYPTQITKVDVEVVTTGNIVVSIPDYPKGGWKGVEAHPDGTLYYKGEKHKELFYETDVKDIKTPLQGKVVRIEDIEGELDQFITLLGLIGHEKQEFLEWWLPRLRDLNSPYIFISLLDQEEKKKSDRIVINPKPDTFIEFIAYFKPVNTPYTPIPLNLPKEPPKRVGFTAVEWGGTINED